MSKRQKTFSFKTLFKSLTVWDAAALAIFIGLVVWYRFAAPLSIDYIDETFYYTIPQRMMMGDRLFVDEWHVSQLTALFQYLPYYLFVRITGGTEGIVLFMRYFSAGVAMLLYWIVYVKLREYRFFGLLIAFCIGIWLPGAKYALNYYSLSAFFSLLLCIVLFLDKKPRSLLQLAAVGLLVSCSVLVQPMYTLIYVLFSIACLVRVFRPNFLKKFDFVINSKTWLGITIGCAVAFVIVVGAIFIKGGAANIFQTIPELFTDSEYDLSFGGGHMQGLLVKLFEILDLYGIVFIVLALICCGISLYYPRMQKRKKLWKAVLFAAGFILLSAQMIHAVYYTLHSVAESEPTTFFYFGNFYTIPVTVFGLSCYALCEKKNPRYFLVWLTGTLQSAISAYSAELVVSIGGLMSMAALVLFLKQLWEEAVVARALTEKENLKKAAHKQAHEDRAFCKKVSKATVCATTCVFIFWLGFGFFYPSGIQPYIETVVNHFPRSSMTQTVEKGPHKGVITTKEVVDIYDRILQDLDRIAADSDGKPFYVAGLCAHHYLYLNDLPISAYSTWYVEADSETRQLRYWSMHPEKRPTYYYIPYQDTGSFVYTDLGQPDRSLSSERKLIFIQSITDCTYEEGLEGYIIKISKWK